MYIGLFSGLGQHGRPRPCPNPSPKLIREQTTQLHNRIRAALQEQQERYCYRSLSPICDIRFSLQGRYTSVTDLSGFGVTNDAVTIGGDAFLAPSRTTVSGFIAKTESEIRRALEGYLRRKGIDANTKHLVVIDIEPHDTSTDPPRDFSPMALGTWEGDPRQNQIIEGYRKRIEVARSVLLNARLGLFQVIAPVARGEDNPRFQQRMRGYQRAGQLGMYDQLDYLSPSLYAHFTPNDVDPVRGITLDIVHAWIEARTRQGIKSSLLLTRTNGKHISLAPFLTFWGRRIMDERFAISPEIMRLQLRILQEYCGVKVIVIWAGPETQEEMRAMGWEPVNFGDFSKQVVELPPAGCVCLPLWHRHLRALSV